MRRDPSSFLRLQWFVYVWLLSLCSPSSSSLAFDDYRSDGGLCDFYQLIEPGNKSYYLYSPGYPNHYRTEPDDRECRWFAKTPSPKDRLVLDCHEFELPEVGHIALPF